MNDKFIYESCARVLSTYSDERITIGRLQVWEHNDPTADSWLCVLDGQAEYAFEVPKSCAVNEVMEGEIELPPKNCRKVVSPPLNYSTEVNGERFYEPGIRELAKRVRQYIEDNSFGARDVGSQFAVDELDLPAGASHIGHLNYNGNFVAINQENKQ